ncbi:hypothetical protein XHV734_3566 [Xanthomonas hortorum pv. vitians]|nr:hypothetical protein XHV734_3566 [Xanthomonas hortorum pv. vitians]
MIDKVPEGGHVKFEWSGFSRQAYTPSQTGIARKLNETAFPQRAPFPMYFFSAVGARLPRERVRRRQATVF